MRRVMMRLAWVLCAAAQVAAQSQPVLKDVFKDAFRIGVALNRDQIYGTDARGQAIALAHFNSMTAENALKWEKIHPQPKTYDFKAADAFVALGQKNHMFVIGHCLVWHNQTPRWVFQDGKGRPLSRRALLRRMREHIHKVVGRYRGRVGGWDVVNEAVDEDGTLRQSPWLKVIGEDYIAKAFQYAREADPKAELYYNDYNLANEPKRSGAIELVKKLKAQGVPITAVGLQGHLRLEWPSIAQEEATITAFGDLGLKVVITELDIDVLPQAITSTGAEVSARAELRPGLNPYAAGLPDDVQQALAKRYAELFGLFLKHKDVVSRVTFWGVMDGDSWKNDWPVRGRVNYPLLFGREGKPKPAYDAVIGTAAKGR